jgi:hypothetical protein
MAENEAHARTYGDPRMPAKPDLLYGLQSGVDRGKQSMGDLHILFARFNLGFKLSFVFGVFILSRVSVGRWDINLFDGHTALRHR